MGAGIFGEGGLSRGFSSREVFGRDGIFIDVTWMVVFSLVLGFVVDGDFKSFCGFGRR